MKFLLDTHTFLWFINGDKLLSTVAQSLIEDPNNEVNLSVASVWEMAIKVSLGKLNVPAPFDQFVSGQLLQNNILLLEITTEHAGAVVTLPFHHRDPFDRLIIAQAIIEKMPVIGKDVVFDAYPVQRYW